VDWRGLRQQRASEKVKEHKEPRWLSAASLLELRAEVDAEERRVDIEVSIEKIEFIL
jgi:hypothetical protein